MDYEVEFDQVGSRGTVMALTSFGLEFTFDALIMPKIHVTKLGHRRVVGENRHNVVKLLSPCCGAIYDVNEDGEGYCHVCSKLSPWVMEVVEFEMLSDAMLAANQWEKVLDRYFPEYLEAQLIAFSLHSSLMEVATAVKNGARIRNFVRSLSREG